MENRLLNVILSRWLSQSQRTYSVTLLISSFFLPLPFDGISGNCHQLSIKHYCPSVGCQQTAVWDQR